MTEAGLVPESLPSGNGVRNMPLSRLLLLAQAKTGTPRGICRQQKLY